MLKRGTPVVAGDLELCDLYNGILVEDWDERTGFKPLVTIQTVIKYPIQTAILWPENANDNAPLREGKSYRLSIVSVRATAETPGKLRGFTPAGVAARLQPAKQHGREDCMAILARHAQGIYDRRRSTADPLRGYSGG